jgi:glycogen(starch) synthase
MPRKQKSAESRNNKLKEKTNEPLLDYLFEVSWEVCNQVGGIYTVIRSKVPTMVGKWPHQYVLLGPYFTPTALSEFEEETDSDNYAFAVVQKMRNLGVEAFFGRWLVTGNPPVVLFNIFSVYPRLPEIRQFFWKHEGYRIPAEDDLLNQALAFSYCVNLFFRLFAENTGRQAKILIHFHEWLASAAIPMLRANRSQERIVFTTHATLLGRYIATNNAAFYEQLSSFDWESESRHYGIEARVRLERTAALGAHCFTTVSEVTSRECLQFLGRRPDVIMPNGLNIERFVALHEFQNLHRDYKNMITQFVMGHFFPSYSFDLDKTVYFFSSGRYEYRNKGFDLTLEALYRLNQRLIKENSPATVVMFFITKKPFHSINPDVMHSRALIEEIKNTCNAMLGQIKDRLIYDVASRKETRLPVLNQFIDEYWQLRLKRTIAAWKTKRLPIVVTHNLADDGNDEILLFLRRTGLVNNIHDRVKIVYHPDFISPTSPLFGMEYGQFVRGCHLGIFPSSYEPWGYTPLECIANGIPAVTSDLSGFGDYVRRTMTDHDENGIWVIGRRGKAFSDAATQLANILHSFVEQSRRERISQRNAVESRSASFDWHFLLRHYEKAYEHAMLAGTSLEK